MRTETIKIYKFKELSKKAQETAIDKLHNINTDYDWFDSTFEDAKEIGKFLGFEIGNIYFSGFSSQGDGACFEGRWNSENVNPKELAGYAPKDEMLKSICAGLAEVKAACGSGFMNIKHEGSHYSHEYMTIFPDVEFMRKRKDIEEDEEDDQVEQDEHTRLEELTIGLARSFMKWIYNQLESQHDYLTGEEAIIETIEANDYEFTKDGQIH